MSTTNKTLKERCKEVMLKHLQSKGYPNLTTEQMLAETKNLWNALDQAGLMPELKASGMTFYKFSLIAQNMAQQEIIFRHLRGES